MHRRLASALIALGLCATVFHGTASPVRASADRPHPPASRALTFHDQPKPVTDFTFKAGAGESRKLADYRGHVLVVNVWAPWCLPCREEMPSLERLQQAVKGHRILVLPISVDRRGARQVELFYLSEKIAGLPTLTAIARDAVAALGEEIMPFTLVIDREGRERARITGAARWDDPAFIDYLKGL